MQGVRSYFDCSNRHINGDDAELLDERAEVIYRAEFSTSYIFCTGTPGGWWVRVDSSERIAKMEEENSHIGRIVRLASKYGCSWVNLDRDGEEHDELPMYEW